jgi:hypothetical protein
MPPPSSSLIVDDNEMPVRDYNLSMRECEEPRPLACDALIFGKCVPR